MSIEQLKDQAYEYQRTHKRQHFANAAGDLSSYVNVLPLDRAMEFAADFAEYMLMLTKHTDLPKRGEPTVGRTANEPHRPLVCYVCAKDFPITFNFCHEHKEEYERLKKENKEEFTRGWNAALLTYPPKEEANENAKHDTLHDLMHFLCTGEATPQIQELFPNVVPNKTVPVSPERSHRPATLGTCKRF